MVDISTLIIVEDIMRWDKRLPSSDILLFPNFKSDAVPLCSQVLRRSRSMQTSFDIQFVYRLIYDIIDCKSKNNYAKWEAPSLWALITSCSR